MSTCTKRLLLIYLIEQVPALLVRSQILSRFRDQITFNFFKVGIICGSGLSGLSKSLVQSETINYSDIPGFSKVTVAGEIAPNRLK